MNDNDSDLNYDSIAVLCFPTIPSVREESKVSLLGGLESNNSLVITFVEA